MRRKGRAAEMEPLRSLSTEVMQSDQSFKRIILAIVWRIGYCSNPSERSGWHGPMFGTKVHRFVSFFSHINYITIILPQSSIDAIFHCLPTFIFQKRRTRPV